MFQSVTITTKSGLIIVTNNLPTSLIVQVAYNDGFNTYPLQNIRAISSASAFFTKPVFPTNEARYVITDPNATSPRTTFLAGEAIESITVEQQA